MRLAESAKVLRFLLLGCLALTGCGGTDRWATQLEWPGLIFSDFPVAENFPDQPAVILLDEGIMQIVGIEAPLYGEFERHKIIRIFNLRGEKYANIMIPYFPNAAVESIQARTISPSGKITVLQSADIYDINLYPDFIFYSDQRARIFTMPAIEPGSIVEYRYKINISGRSLWHSWIFQDQIPTLHSRFTLVHPAEWKLNYRQYHLETAPEIVKVPDGFKSTRVWDVRDIPGLTPEFAMPPRSQIVSRLSFAPLGVDSWDDVSRWYRDLSGPQMKADEDIRQLARSLTEGVSGEMEKLRHLYEWVRDNVRYVAVEVGIGGYQPNPAARIMQNQYGDCKDMATLLGTLAGECGIDVLQVLVSTRPNGSPDTTLPSPFQFNHVILYCPTAGENGLWMDATEKGCPFGTLPWYDQGVTVLIVHPDGSGKIAQTPQAAADSNCIAMEWQIDCRFCDSSTVEGKTRFYGAPSTEMREQLIYLSAHELHQWLESDLTRRSPGVLLDSVWVTGLHPVKDPLVLNYRFRAPMLIMKRNDQYVIQPGELARYDVPNYFRSERRLYDVFFRFGYRQEIRLEITLPENISVAISDYEDQEISRFGSFYWMWHNEDGKLSIQNIYRLSTRRILTEEYPEFQAFLSAGQIKDQQEIILSGYPE